ncbi:unnamed protein product [Closterium sp. Naga37s-1]|nr:unnamed protein product [Closterium sp. Naga37s-1]
MSLSRSHSLSPWLPCSLTVAFALSVAPLLSHRRSLALPPSHSLSASFPFSPIVAFALSLPPFPSVRSPSVAFSLSVRPVLSLGRIHSRSHPHCLPHGGPWSLRSSLHSFLSLSLPPPLFLALSSSHSLLSSPCLLLSALISPPPTPSSTIPALSTPFPLPLLPPLISLPHTLCLALSFHSDLSSPFLLLSASLSPRPSPSSALPALSAPFYPPPLPPTLSLPLPICPALSSSPSLLFSLLSSLRSSSCPFLFSLILACKAFGGVKATAWNIKLVGAAYVCYVAPNPSAPSHLAPRPDAPSPPAPRPLLSWPRGPTPLGPRPLGPFSPGPASRRL